MTNLVPPSLAVLLARLVNTKQEEVVTIQRPRQFKRPVAMPRSSNPPLRRPIRREDRASNM